MTTKEKEESSRPGGVSRRQFATSAGALASMLAVGELACSQAPVEEAGKGAGDQKPAPASASARNRSTEATSTGPWDNPALAKFREWEEVLKICTAQGLQSSNLGVPILAEELARRA